MSARSIIVLVVLTAAALASWYVARSNRAADVDQAPYDTQHRGYYLKSARILGTDKDGSLLYEIEAEEAVQEAQDRIKFTNVRIRYSPDSDIPWTVHADEATLREDSPRIALRGHVRAVGQRGDDQEDVVRERLQVYRRETEPVLALAVDQLLRAAGHTWDVTLRPEWWPGTSTSAAPRAPEGTVSSTGGRFQTWRRWAFPSSRRGPTAASS